MCDKNVPNWQHLKTNLMQMYSDKKHYTQLGECIPSRKTIIKYVPDSCIKIDKLKSRLLDTTSFCDPAEIHGRSQTMIGQALQNVMVRCLTTWGKG